MQQRIDVTVAAVIELDERFLLVEERVNGRLVLNQPAGHVEPGESLVDAVVREALEETGFAFEPEALVGIYLWHSRDAGISFLRTAFCGRATAPAATPSLDAGIVGVHWLRRGEIPTHGVDLRSPLVLRCIDDYLAGVRYPLTCITQLSPGVHGTQHSASS